MYQSMWLMLSLFIVNQKKRNRFNPKEQKIDKENNIYEIH